MFDPKDIYSQLNIQNCIGEDVWYELQIKEWPCTEMVHVRLYLLADPNRQTWVLIAPGSTVETVTESLRTASDRLRKEAARSGF